MIHKYSLNGYNIVIDVASGAVHVMDELSFTILDDAESMGRDDVISKYSGKYEAADIGEAYDEIHQLVDGGILFSEDTYQGVRGHSNDEPIIKSMCLNIAHDCNLTCDYCLAGTGGFGRDRSLMSAEVGKCAIDFLVSRSGERPVVEVDFFGGEPLMNLDAVKEIVSYARGLETKSGKKFRFTITTNGTLLNDEYIAFINKEMSNVVLSIDGRPSVNDKFRKFAGGRGTYDKIIDKYKKLVQSRTGDYYVRGTFTKDNLDFAEDVEFLYNQGFDQISVEPVVVDSDLPYAITEEDLPAIFDEYERLAKKIIEWKKAGSGINFFHFKIDLDGGPCAVKRVKGCGRGSEYVAVTPEGDIYPCHQFVGMDDWKMGSVLTGQTDGKARDEFAHADMYSCNECRGCWARFYCGGGCWANNALYAGGVYNPLYVSCAMQKKRIECAIMMKAAAGR